MVVKKITPTYTFQQFNTEINELYDYLRSKKYKEEEIKKIFSPLTSKIKKTQTSTSLIIPLALFCISIYLLTYFDTLYWHISAIGRIILIKLLPFFDWRYLKNKPCLIEKFKSTPVTTNHIFNCNLCENIKNIHVYEDIDEDILIQRYLDLDVPVILTKELEEWPKDSIFIEELMRDDIYYNSYPCKVSSSTIRKSSFAEEILERVKLFDDFFLHFQNCELEAMRIFRRFTYRPKFLPPSYSPIIYNWLLWNKDYNTTNYKTIDLVEPVTVLGQLFGSTHIRLTPRLNCRDVCPVLDITLGERESIIFTNLWDLEYRPNEVGENMAVILETKN